MSNIFSFFTKKKGKILNNISNKLKRNINKENLNLGYIRQFPPANIEWSNSIYVYNKNYLKVLPSFDKMVTKLIKSYFYLYDKKKKKKSISRRMRIRLRRLSVNRIFVSKAEIKHTNSKAIVTIYIYNAEKRYLLNKLKKIKSFLSIYNFNKIKKKKLFNKTILNLIIFNTIFIKNLYKNIYYFYLKKLKKRAKTKKIFIYYLKRQYETVIKSFIKKSLRKEKLYLYYKYLLWFNKSKFENTYIYPLNKLIKNFYNKKIEFNLVNLKYLHLNSDILTESITIKLKNRKNSLTKILDICLRKVKLPIYNKNSEMFSYVDKWEKNKLSFFNKLDSLNLINRLSAIKVSNDNKNVIENKDFLDQYIQDIFLAFAQKKHQKENYLVNLILNSIKRKTISGLRLEASGRLSRRLTAARSVFKFRYIGTLRNIDSSYKGLPSVMLRGHLKSNLQYTLINSKTRNGSYGLKGWVSTL